ncbi:MAG: 5-methylthioadenosine/S-adenosylhomocysteine deaminase [Gammaproteobacteria bacterium]|jgi:5-methylthioadenosine/S-adenosylhomocysteine deaminase
MTQLRPRTLVTGRWVFTGAEGLDDVLTDGAIVVEHGRVLDVGSRRSMRERYPDARIVGSDRYAVMPGLINAHHHSHGASAVQHGIQDQVLEPWILSLARKRATNPYLNTLLASARMLRSGVTTVVDNFGGGGTADQYSHHVRNALRGYEHSGMRVAFAAGFKTDGFLISGNGEDQRFIESLPRELQILATRRLPEPNAMTEEEYFSIMENHYERYAKHERVDLWFGPPGPQWVSPQFLCRVAQLAEQWNVGVQTHVNESIYQKILAGKFYGEPTILYLERLGVLSPRFSIAHGVWSTAQEMDVLARNGVSVSHNPSSNLRLRAGIAPVLAMLDAGVNVALGMDGATLNDDDDMFTELRLAHRLHASPTINGPALSLRKAWSMATLGGALLYGRPGILGRLAAGYAADIVLVDLERIERPWVAPEVDPLTLTLLRARAGDVDTVMVAGEVVYERGEPTRFDEREAEKAFFDALDQTPYPSDAVEMVDELRPRVEAWHEDIDVPPLDPWMAQNSK